MNKWDHNISTESNTLRKKAKKKNTGEATNWMGLMGSHLLRHLLPAQASRDHVTYLAM